MKMTELRDMSNDELHTKLEDLREELFNLRFQKASNRLENPGRIGVVRKDIARVKTLQTQRVRMNNE
ncbi:MAG: 50S ribosomal protein L29 [Candidatus Cloacimonetes bacterium]|nr:50S ribosomal protein L29 [Candidatus Cloacimonadota bacterium]